MARTPEGKVKDMVTAVLKEYKVWYFFPSSNGFGKAGIPDIIALHKGKFIGIETKANTKKNPTELQALCGAQIVSAGGYWFLIRGKDELAQLIALLESLR